MNPLPYLFALLAAFAVMMYVLTDGWDLGVGILIPFAPNRDTRQVMIRSIEPFWDGNETWLVFGGMILLAAFPVAYSTLLPTCYLSIISMLFGLVFRGVAFEFRHHSLNNRRAWDYVFAGGSLISTFAQGTVLGHLIQGLDVVEGGGKTIVAELFPYFCGVGLIGGYGLLGACWLILKTEASTQLFARAIARNCLLATTFFIVLASIWTPIASPEVASRWFDGDHLMLVSPIPILTALVVFALWRSLSGISDTRPLRLGILLFFFSYVGFGISMWPYVVPYRISITEGAGANESLGFIAMGAGFLVPIILMYIGFGYWTFRGKVSEMAEVEN